MQSTRIYACVYVYLKHFLKESEGTCHESIIP
jgi:hypothetical protein